MAAAFLVLLFVPSASALVGKTEYVVGAWRPGTQKSMLAELRPLFEDYLTAEVGPLYDPPIRFSLVPVDYGSSTDSDDQISAGIIDFMCKFL